MALTPCGGWEPTKNGSCTRFFSDAGAISATTFVARFGAARRRSQAGSIAPTAASIAQAPAIQFLCVAICSRLASLLFCVANFRVSVKREGVRANENRGSESGAGSVAVPFPVNAAAPSVVAQEAEVANPMSRYPRFKRHRNLWLPKWSTVWCQVTVEDGTFGLGMTSHGSPVAAIINEHLAPLLVGEEALATEKLWDM
jgi:hypothetical protein